MAPISKHSLMGDSIPLTIHCLYVGKLFRHWVNQSVLNLDMARYPRHLKSLKLYRHKLIILTMTRIFCSRGKMNGVKCNMAIIRNYHKNVYNFFSMLKKYNGNLWSFIPVAEFVIFYGNIFLFIRLVFTFHKMSQLNAFKHKRQGKNGESTQVHWNEMKNSFAENCRNEIHHKFYFFRRF